MSVPLNQQAFVFVQPPVASGCPTCGAQSFTLMVVAVAAKPHIAATRRSCCLSRVGKYFAAPAGVTFEL